MQNSTRRTNLPQRRLPNGIVAQSYEILQAPTQHSQITATLSPQTSTLVRYEGKIEWQWFPDERSRISYNPASSVIDYVEAANDHQIQHYTVKLTKGEKRLFESLLRDPTGLLSPLPQPELLLVDSEDPTFLRPFVQPFANEEVYSLPTEEDQ